MATTADIKNGLMIRFNNDIYQIIEFLHVKPGKGGAFVRTKLKSVTTGNVLDHTFRSGEKLDTVRVERRPYQYLYREGKDFMFMNLETFEQIAVGEHLIEGVEFLEENMVCDFTINADDDQVLAVDLPHFVVLEVAYTEPGVKGDTATNALKPATLSTGAQIKVPLFVDVGEKIRIDTRTKSYMERVKS
ncbi:MAG: elongation factor P [Bacteroidia bacterium]|nr:elongation factor P [Bacteroidia bacterium]MDW8332799.1 elongation factor P [Bacteroidia bacterium]